MKPGEVLHERYRIQRRLGQGGQGAVYLARHIQLEQMVAIKQLVLQDAADAERLESVLRQFTQEARTLCQLRHPSLPRVSDFFSVDGGHYYLVMDYIEGDTLGTRLRRLGRLPVADVVEWGRALCQVLAYLHGHQPQVIMRDLKPDNVMIDTNGQLKLIDFGIAKILDPVKPMETSTHARGAGTPGFAAIEQYSSGTDARTDVYALGATLYCLLAGEAPPPAPMRAARLVTLPPLRSLRPDVPTAVDEAILFMLGVVPSERPQSMGEVARLLSPEALGERDGRNLPTGILTPAATSASPGHSRPPSQRVDGPPILRRALPAAGLVAVILSVLGLTRAIHPLLTVHLDSRPEGASVVVNHTPASLTPCDVRSVATDKPMLVELTLPGYTDYSGHLTVEASPAPIILTPAPVMVHVTGSPPGTLQVDGADRDQVGPTESTLMLAPGTHKLKVSAIGFRPWQSQCDLKAGQGQDFHYALQAMPVSLVVEGPGGTKVRLPPLLHGTIPGGGRLVLGQVMPGDYLLSLTLKGTTLRTHVVVSPGTETRFTCPAFPTTAAQVAPPVQVQTPAPTRTVIILPPPGPPRPGVIPTPPSPGGVRTHHTLEQHRDLNPPIRRSSMLARVPVTAGISIGDVSLGQDEATARVALQSDLATYDPNSTRTPRTLNDGLGTAVTTTITRAYLQNGKVIALSTTRGSTSVGVQTTTQLADVQRLYGTPQEVSEISATLAWYCYPHLGIAFAYWPARSTIGTMLIFAPDDIETMHHFTEHGKH